jgi:hypothetical protein
LLKNSAESKYESGLDFSRADKVNKMSRASAPADPSFAGFAFHSDFFRNLFSRADIANKMRWASAPEGCFFANSLRAIAFVRSLLRP